MNIKKLVYLVICLISLLGLAQIGLFAQSTVRREALPNFVTVDAVLVSEPRQAFLPLLEGVEGMQEYVIAEYRLQNLDVKFRVYYIKDSAKPSWSQARLSCSPLFQTRAWRWYQSAESTFLFDPNGPVQNWLLFEFPTIIDKPCTLIVHFLQSLNYMRAIEARKNPSAAYDTFFPALIGRLP